MVGVVGSSPIAPTNFLRFTNDPQGNPWGFGVRRSLECAAVQWILPAGPNEGIHAVQNKKRSSARQGAPEPRIIKKYPNRRLYDTDTSTYITLAEVRHLVMDSEVFVVRDAKTNEDLTRSILLQIILEEEAGGAPMFTEAVLANIIRFYGNAMQGLMGTYLEKNVQTFMDLQARVLEQSKGLTPEMLAQLMSMQSPMMQGMMGSYVEQSRNMFLQMQEQMQKQTEQMLGTFGLKR
jgi:polyhydroxyalkanoate synthesis repressor PhaR